MEKPEEKSEETMKSCSLFTDKKYQYGPCCAYKEREIVERAPKSVLTYYPVGSGKTLSALHAARVFLDSNPSGRVFVFTTKSNIDTSWSDNIHKYNVNEQPECDLGRIQVQNIDWWFSQSVLPHYNRLIRLMSIKSSNHRAAYVDIPWLTLLRDAKRTLKKSEWSPFKDIIDENNRSFLDACIPSERYMLIVDECQQYLNYTSHQQLISKFCQHSYFTILLSATPLNDSEQEGGLCRMLRSRQLHNRILFIPTQDDMVAVHHRYIGAKMSTDETRAFLTTKKDDAYLTKGRQLCNTTTKFTKILKYIGTKTVIYSFFRENGVDGFFKFLSNTLECVVQSQYSLILSINARKIHVRIFSDAKKDIQWFNRTSSKNKMLLITSKAQLGISLVGVQFFHIMEPQWTYTDEAQAIGRVTRIGSHQEGDTVTVFHWVSTAGRYESSDEIVRHSMEQKKQRTDNVLKQYQQRGGEYLQYLLNKFGIYSI